MAQGTFKKLSQYIATWLPQDRHNLKRDFERKYCFWDFKNFIIFLGFFLNFSPHFKKKYTHCNSGHRGHYDHIWTQKKII